MMKSFTRRLFMSSAAASAIALGTSARSAANPNRRAGEGQDGKRVTLLHFTDTHAQLETHPEYLPGASPEMMGGYARLKTAIEQERANCDGACLLDGGDGFRDGAGCQGERRHSTLRSRQLEPYGPEKFKETMAGSLARSSVIISTTPSPANASLHPLSPSTGKG